MILLAGSLYCAAACTQPAQLTTSTPTAATSKGTVPAPVTDRTYLLPSDASAHLVCETMGDVSTTRVTGAHGPSGTIDFEITEIASPLGGGGTTSMMRTLNNKPSSVETRSGRSIEVYRIDDPSTDRHLGKTNMIRWQPGLGRQPVMVNTGFKLSAGQLADLSDSVKVVDLATYLSVCVAAGLNPRLYVSSIPGAQMNVSSYTNSLGASEAIGLHNNWYGIHVTTVPPLLGTEGTVPEGTFGFIDSPSKGRVGVGRQGGLFIVLRGEGGQPNDGDMRRIYESLHPAGVDELTKLFQGY